MSRPFFNIGIGELEKAFDRERNNPEFLLKLIDECEFQVSSGGIFTGAR